VIETERLTLRRFREDDRDTVARWNADPDFTRHLAGVQTREQSDEAFDRWERHWQERGFGPLAVVWRETGDLIGRAGPQFHRYWPADPEVGWALDPRWWGRGIATEAGAASVAWSFGDLGFERLVSITTEPNLASRNVMAKLGFELHTTLESEWGPLLVHARNRSTGV
jgi:RimJ/RimL family protein N-acetyltransferase